MEAFYKCRIYLVEHRRWPRRWSPPSKGPCHLIKLSEEIQVKTYLTWHTGNPIGKVKFQVLQIRINAFLSINICQPSLPYPACRRRIKLKRTDMISDAEIDIGIILTD